MPMPNCQPAQILDVNRFFVSIFIFALVFIVIDPRGAVASLHFASTV